MKKIVNLLYTRLEILFLVRIINFVIKVKLKKKKKINAQ